MKPVFFLILLTFVLTPSWAQSPRNTITGVVMDSQNVPLPGATVSLYHITDSTLISGNVSKADGKFVFIGLTNGMYYLRVSSVGSTPYISGTLTIDEQHHTITLPAILLNPSKTTLKEVNVLAKRPLVEQDIDKTIVNVDALISSAGNNTLEILEKTPGVTVDGNGTISLNGKSGVLVLIDGKQTYMSGQDLAVYLRSLPGGSLDKLELMTNPPARYDAAGSAIINIRLKRNRAQGFTGNLSVSYTQGRMLRNDDVINLNFNRKKLNLFGTLAYNKGANYSDDVYNRTFYNDDTSASSFVQLNNQYKYNSHGLMARFGLDYAVSPNTTYGFIVNVNSRPSYDRLDYWSVNRNARSIVDSIGRGYTDGDYRWKSISANINYQHRFTRAGREITADVDYINYRSDGSQQVYTFSYLPDGMLNRHNRFIYDLPYDITIYTAKADYTHPFKNKATLDVGIKSSLVNTDNNSNYFTAIASQPMPDYGKSNHFVYKEMINAAYINTRREWKRITIQAGLRLENTLANGRQLGNTEVTGSSFNKNYTRLFPTAYIRYKLDTVGNNSLTFSLARRINRPNYQYLNPFVFYRDNYSYTSGNPLLNPQYNDQVELKYQYKAFLGVALQYNRYIDVIFQTTQAIDNIFITTPNNVAKGYILALATNVSVSPTTWWRLNANVIMANMALSGVAYSEPLTLSTNNLRVNLLNQLSFAKGWSAELVGFYSSKSLAGQTITNSRYRINTAVQKKILTNKGSIRLLVDDLFYSWRQVDQILSLKQVDALHTNVSDTRRIGLAFTYQFGKETFARKRHHTDNAADAEKGRVD